ATARVGLADSGALHRFSAAADLLARLDELEDQRRDALDIRAVAATPDARQLPRDLHGRRLVLGLHQLDRLRRAQYADIANGGAARGLRVLALSILWRQASVLLASDEPHGAAGGLRAAVLPALLGFRPDRHAHCGRPRALPL